MGAVKQHLREQLLRETYTSVDRQTQHILDDNNEGVIAESHLQQNLRGRFELFVEEAE